MATVAILPSNQDGNKSPIIPAYNEAGGMQYLSPLIVERCRARGVNAQWFPVEPASKPGQQYAHQWIAQAVERANLWLRSQGGGVMVHLHTDSGDYSHTFGIYAGRSWPEGKVLAATLARQVHEALATEEWRVFDQLGDRDYNTYVFATRAEYTPVLLELCAHTVERDIRALWAHPDRVADYLARGLALYFGVQPVDWEARYKALEAEHADEAARTARARELARQLQGVLG